MAEPAAAEPPVGWPAAEVELLDAGVPLDPPVYRSMLDAQVAAPEGQLHPDLAALNADQPAPRAVQQAQGEPQTLPDIIESWFVPMLHLRRSLLVFEPRGQLAEERQARKRQRRTGQRDDDVDYDGNSYSGRCGVQLRLQLPGACGLPGAVCNRCGQPGPHRCARLAQYCPPCSSARRYNFLPSGSAAVPVIAKRTTTLTRTSGNVVHQVSRVARVLLHVQLLAAHSRV